MDNNGIKFYNKPNPQSREYAINTYKEIQDMNNNLDSFVGRQNMNQVNNNYSGRQNTKQVSNGYAGIQMNKKPSNTRIQNINKKAINKKKNLVKMRVTVFLTSAAIMFFAGLGIGNLKNKNKTVTPQPVTIGDDKILTKISVNAFNGDTISGIASDFYNDDYENVYGSMENFIESIFVTNNIDSPERLITDTIKIPVVVDVDNPYLQNITSKNMQLFELEENEKWVKYTVKFNDTLTNLASYGSGNDYVGENSSEVKEIIRYNNLSSSNIYVGQELWIINPKIGDLKKEISEANTGLIESLKNNYKTK